MDRRSICDCACQARTLRESLLPLVSGRAPTAMRPPGPRARCREPRLMLTYEQRHVREGEEHEGRLELARVVRWPRPSRNRPRVGVALHELRPVRLESPVLARCSGGRARRRACAEAVGRRRAHRQSTAYGDGRCGGPRQRPRPRRLAGSSHWLHDAAWRRVSSRTSAGVLNAAGRLSASTPSRVFTLTPALSRKRERERFPWSTPSPSGRGRG
jgi:hypothetical protein